VRSFLRDYVGTNPTWVRQAPVGGPRISLRWPTIREAFIGAIRRLPLSAAKGQQDSASLRLASTTALPQFARQATLALTSPPYCTRIDYAVATRPEMALLGLPLEDQSALRRQMLGTTTVPRSLAVSSGILGTTAVETLDRVSKHPSRASSTYYWKWLAQYLCGYAASFHEVAAVMASDSVLALVVQDSYYKDVHIDLPVITAQLADINGWRVIRQFDFGVSRTMASMNTRSRRYRNDFSAVERVLVMRRG
jgi:hypothetical protein